MISYHIISYYVILYYTILYYIIYYIYIYTCIYTIGGWTNSRNTKQWISVNHFQACSRVLPTVPPPARSEATGIWTCAPWRPDLSKRPSTSQATPTAGLRLSWGWVFCLSTPVMKVCQCPENGLYRYMAICLWEYDDSHWDSRILSGRPIHFSGKVILTYPRNGLKTFQGKKFQGGFLLAGVAQAPWMVKITWNIPI